MIIKAIFSDLDGTLKSSISEDSVPEKVLDKIKKIQSKNILFSIATGKSRKKIFNYKIPHVINGPLILENGCVILEKENFEYKLNKKWDKYIRQEIKYLKKLSDYFKDRNVIWKTRTFTIKGGPEPRIPERFSKSIEFKKNRQYYDFFPVKAGKLNAIKYICKKNKISLSNVLYMGDDINDIDILERAGLPCTMKNAPEGVKKIVRERGGIITRMESYWGALQIFRMVLKEEY